MQANAYSGANHQQWSLEKYTLSVTAPQSQIVVGETMQIGKNSTALAITWSSSDKNVATVSSDGKVTGCNPGTATITAKAANGMTASCSIRVRHADPFYPDNIEYMRVKKYDCSSYGGDSDITTTVVISALNQTEYFEMYAPERDKISFKINQSLIDILNAKEADYPHAILANAIYHEAKVFTDELVKSGLIENKSAEYYGIWASESVRLELVMGKVQSAIQLTLAAATIIYSTYTIVSAMKAAKMPMNTTQTYNTAEYKATAFIADDLVSKMTNNSSSKSAMLGTEAGGKAWYKIAQEKGMSYFYSENYNNYVSQYGYDAMLASNRDYIFRAKEAGKTFWFSHDPIAQLSNYPDSTFAYEIRYLQRLFGISESKFQNYIIKSGEYYYLAP